MPKILICMLLPTLFCSSFLFSQVRISSEFESGSLGKYEIIDSSKVKISDKDSLKIFSVNIFSRFDPLNPIDTTLAPSARWYYFKMTGVKGKQIFLNIKNSEAIRPFYSYDGITFKRFDASENINRNQVFKIFQKDTVYISHYIPYTYSRNQAKIGEWALKPFVKVEEIGKSLNGLAVDMLTITDTSIPDKGKKRVWIHGRSHPSEQPANWHLEALINNIVADTPEARDMRRETVFYIVPMINPDGVAGGYSRSTSTGVNIEINWDRPDSLTMPEVKLLKKKISQLTAEAPFDLLLNMHSQIANSATYWIHTAKSTSSRFLAKQILLSSLTMGERNYYAPGDQSFSDMGSKYPEGWIWNQFGEKTLPITFETPYTFFTNNPSGEWVSTESLSALGLNSFNAVYDFLKINGSSRIIIEPVKFSKRRWENISDSTTVFFGDNFLKCKKEKSKIYFSKPYLEKGNYKLFIWVVGPAGTTFDEHENRWVKAGIVNQKNSGKFKWKGVAQSGETADAILLIKE